MSEPKVISKLDQSVINKICAGEVIHRPFNVVKELIENSLDANSTSISIVLKNGGLTRIQIVDNGSGIRKDDLVIVCNRFTTSKLDNVDDLQSLTTFGFRGEALSSISTVAHLSIITKTANSPCGYKAEFIDGKLKDGTKITPLASNNGTTIIVENLFYNIPTRRAALTSESFEFNLVQDLITKYSILYSEKCAFSLKKQADKIQVVDTKISNSMFHNINILFGQSISSHLLPINLSNEKLCFKIDGYFSNNDLNSKKMNFLLFINSRLVECSMLKNSLKEMYKNYLMKGGHPFVLLILEIDSKNIDVNVHPTKNEVCFLHQNEIFSEIISAIEEKLRNKDVAQIRSQNFSQSQSLASFFPKLDKSDESLISKESKHESTMNDSISSKMNSFSRQSECSKLNKSARLSESIYKPFKKPFHPSKQVRTDSKMQRIDRYLNQRQVSNKQRRDLHLTSLSELRDEIVKNVDQNLFELITKSTYVGCVDETYALIQHELNLIMINVSNFNQELFYQLILLDFGNFDYIEFKNPLPIPGLLKVYFEANSASDGTDYSEKANQITNLLIEKRYMLDDYFSIKINAETKSLEAIPCLVDGHMPVMYYLPDFLHRLVSNVNWNEEKECFSSIGIELKNFYCHTPCAEDLDYQCWASLVEDTLYPLYKTLLFPSSFLTDRNSIHYLTNITDLYKVFERC